MLLLFNQYYLLINIAHVVHFKHHVLYKYSYISEGRRHDAGMVGDSNLLQDLNQFAYSRAGRPLCIYGDLAYPLQVHLQAPFRRAVINQQMAVYNAAMSSVRTSVEWLFGDIKNHFKYLDFKKNLKIGLNSIGKMHIVCALLQNGLTCNCLYGNKTAEYFDCEPPHLLNTLLE